MSEVLDVVLSIPPSNVNHMYGRAKNGGIFKLKEIADWGIEARNKIRKVPSIEKKERYSVNMGFYYDNKRKNDIDSKIKIVLDMLQDAGVFENDSLVVDLIVAKRFDKEHPRLEISVY
jgi:Holliday junction resolvase RusA-like endonuclease